MAGWMQRSATLTRILNHPLKLMKHTHNKVHPDRATGDLAQWGGIWTGRLSAWAAYFGASPSDVVEAADVVPPLMDTARNQSRETHERPTSPELRCIAWNRGDVARVEHLVS
jgi:hypothetical protein